MTPETRASVNKWPLALQLEMDTLGHVRLKYSSAVLQGFYSGSWLSVTQDFHGSSSNFRRSGRGLQHVTRNPYCRPSDPV